LRFGPVALAQAAGGVLAHSIRLPGLVFRKGRVLSPEDIQALREAGVAEVIVALCSADDIPEDRAASLIAARAAGAHLTAAAPFTGRANLISAVSGLLLVDKPRVDALNRIEEAITLATLGEFDPVEPRQMAATVKIIPFAVQAETLEHCLAIIGTEPLLSIAPFMPRRAALIQTELPGTKPSVLDATEAVTRNRLNALGSELARTARTAHDTDALAREIATSQRQSLDLILIAGASAVVDRQDVIPAAIEQAGGAVEHFGMPVDPGNLLLIGHLGDTPILGMPGCARSPKINGFDWVLQRLCAGLTVTRADIMGMGVGGLLKEIPSRPQPREGEPATKVPRAPKIAAIVLAAGRSTRMGERNKLLMDWRGEKLIAQIVSEIGKSSVSDIVVVTGHQETEIRAALAGKPLIFAHNPRYAEGLSTSLATGIQALPPDLDGVVIALGDMPLVDAGIVERLIAAFDPLEGRAICLPTFQGRWGNPVLWAARFLPEMASLTGDAGARGLLQSYAELICEVAMPDDAILADVDTPDTFAALAARSSS
jgi:molybdenum cofactor cytidylyltransferase